MNEPRVIWGNDGWAATDGWAHAHCVDQQTGELRMSHDVWVSRGCGLPACAHLDDPMDAVPGQAIVRRNDAWALVDDHRGQTAYHRQTRQSVAITELGPLPPELTLLAPSSPFDRWDEDNGIWTHDAAAEQDWQRQQAEAQRNALMAEANQQIAILADAVELGMAPAEEQTAYTAWRQYRVLLSRLDLTQQPVEWPPKPGTV
ncbi:tail fiber assembly protein [Aeromonas caviae]